MIAVFLAGLGFGVTLGSLLTVGPWRRAAEGWRRLYETERNR